MSQNVEPAIIPEGQQGKVGSGRPGSKPRSIAISTVGQFLPFLGSIRYARDTKSRLRLTGREEGWGRGGCTGPWGISVCLLPILDQAPCWE